VFHAFAVGKFVPQATLQSTAHPRQLRRVQAQVLLLRHLDRDGLEGLKERGAAERPAARPVPTEHPRFISHTDLAHLDTHSEMRGEVADELTEIHASFCRVIKDEAGAVEHLFDPRQLHRQPPLPDFHEADAVGLLLTVLMFQPGHNIVAGGAANHLEL
jgi:hypothetical protein